MKLIGLVASLVIGGTQPGGGAGLGIKCPANQAVTQIAPGNSLCGPAGGSSNLTCPAGQFIQQLTNGSDGGNCAAAGGSSQWVLVDCDPEQQAAQTFASDNTYTLCGKTISAVNTQMSSPAMYVSDAGIVISPADAGTYYFGSGAGATDFINAPLIAIKLSDWIPNYTSDTPVEVAAYVTTTNESAQFSGWFIGIDDYYGPSARDGSYYLPNTVNSNPTNFDQGNLWFNGGRKQGPSGSSGFGFAGTNSHKITLWNGFVGAKVMFWNCNWTGPWCPWQTVGGTMVSSATDFDSQTFGTPCNPDGNERVVIGAEQWGSTTLITATVKHISIWYKAR